MKTVPGTTLVVQLLFECKILSLVQKRTLLIVFLSMVEFAADQPTTTGLTPASGTTGWELALVTAPSSNESATATSKLVS